VDKSIGCDKSEKQVFIDFFFAIINFQSLTNYVFIFSCFLVKMLGWKKKKRGKLWKPKKEKKRREKKMKEKKGA
jgi:hypothetical protein